MPTTRRRRRSAEEDDEPRRKRPRREKEEKSGLSVKTYSGLNERRMASKSGGANDKIYLIADKTVTVQFMTDPDGFLEYDIHGFRESGAWKFVPCAGDDCPLCEDEDRDVSRTAYRFAAVAWDCNRKQLGVIEGPNSLSMRILKRYKSLANLGKERLFTKKTWDITRLDTKPIQYDVDTGSMPSQKVPSDKTIDLKKWVQKEMERYYGDDMPGSDSNAKRRTSLDDDEADDDDDEKVYTRTELKTMEPRALKKLARSLDIDITGLNSRSIINAIIEEQE